MTMRVARTGHPLAMIAALLLGMVGLAPAVAAQPIPPPTVGEIKVESLDCDTGQLEYRVPVANLLSAASGSDDDEFPLAIFVYLYFEDGSNYASYTPPYLTFFSPSAGEAPYTGSVHVESVIFVTASDTASPLESLEFSAFVGNPVPDSSVIGNPSDTSTMNYTVDCDDDSLVDSLVAALKRILRGILDG